MALAAELASPPQHPAVGPDRVLVVDDEQAIVAVETEILRHAGYDTVGVKHPYEALALDVSDIDVVVTDYRMPDLNGLRLFEELRRLNPQLVGVMVTGFGNLRLVQTAMQSGFAAILLKPFPLDRLSDAVQRALRQRQVAGENSRLQAVLDAWRISQELTRPRTRLELADELAVLAATAAQGGPAGVLLADLSARRWRRPFPSRLTAWPALCLELADQPLQTPPDPLAAAAVLRLQVGDTPEGLLVVETSEPLSDVTTEQLELLAQQGALALAHMRLFEQGLRDEKLALVGRLAGAICERVRVPVARIEAAARELEVDEPDYRDMIVENAERLLLMCGELADFLSGDFRLDRRACSLRGLLDDAVRFQLPELNRLGVRVRVEAPDDLELDLDPRRILRALQNLVKNACEAMPSGGLLRLSLQLSAAVAVIEVSDTGCGMPPEVAAQVFEPFFTHGKPRGTGLGGAVIRSAVTAHGGMIEVASRLGSGTTFRLTFPRREAPAP
ncbi:MAG: response regulator [Fimbriimonadaceae bacterium]|nr:response regulator [Fimbriimonadaceae bacterium]